MNQKGFGLKEFVIIIAIIFVCAIIIMSLYRSIIPNATTSSVTGTKKLTYKDLEDRLELAAERYQNDNYSGNASDTEVWELSYSMLRKEKYLDKLIDPNDEDTECTGYVEFIQDEAKVMYKPFLKCGTNYETKGYDGTNNIKESEWTDSF